MSNEVTKFVRYSTTVDTMQEAWVFVMEYVDNFESPDIEIKSVTAMDTNDPSGEWVDKIIVTLYGEEKGESDDVDHQ